MTESLLPVIQSLEEIELSLPSLDDDTMNRAAEIVSTVKHDGRTAVQRFAAQYDGLTTDQPLIISSDELNKAKSAIDSDTLALLERTAQRIERFAAAQRATLTDLTTNIGGGRAGHTVRPVDRAGCYAPGGRYPLVSSVLMMAVTARAAGVPSITVATPRPTALMCAAAAIAGVDNLLAVGGAHAIAALAYGMDALPACDVVVGPGNRFVTAAKKLVSGDVAIDMLAGPSEVLIVADDTSDPRDVAIDLLAQAEHDADARPMLITLAPELAVDIQDALRTQLESLPTAATARQALKNGFVICAANRQQAADWCNLIAPEHLQLALRAAESIRPLLRHYGTLLIGNQTPEVFGDYGAGPNHVLPTGGTARYTGGLSVFSFLKTQSWLRVDRPERLAEDVAALARLEGLAAHESAASRFLETYAKT